MLMRISLLVGLVSASGLAMQEDHLQSVRPAEILQGFEDRSEGGAFFGKDMVPIAYRKFEVENEKGALVILPGRGEPLHKYAELIFDLQGLGYSIYIMSHRGQGESGQVDGCSIQYVENYSDYIADLKMFMDSLVSQKPHARVVLLAHSMGAAIGTLYSLKHPNTFSGLILSSPMFDMRTPGYPKVIAKFLAKSKVDLGYGQKEGGSDNLRVTSSTARQEITNLVLKEHSSIESEKISYGWAKASLDAIKEIRKADLSSLPPVLLLQAGMDLHVPVRGQNKVCNKMASCKKVSFPSSFHEILMEQDAIRDAALAEIKNFLSDSRN